MDSPIESSDDTRKLRLLLLTARPEEYGNCLESFDFDEHLHQNHSYRRLEGATWDVRLTHTGIGPEATRATLGKLEGLLEPDFVLIAGTAGSLSDDLERDSVYVPTAVRSTGQEDWFHPETRILQWLMGTLKEAESSDSRFRSGPLVTADEPVTDPEQRRTLKKQNQALAVDMESSTIVETLAAAVSDPPDWGVVRVISDTPSDSDLATIKSRQSRGAEQTGKLLSNLLSNLLDT